VRNGCRNSGVLSFPDIVKDPKVTASLGRPKVKKLSASGVSSPWLPDQGLCPWTSPKVRKLSASGGFVP